MARRGGLFVVRVCCRPGVYHPGIKLAPGCYRTSDAPERAVAPPRRTGERWRGAADCWMRGRAVALVFMALAFSWPPVVIALATRLSEPLRRLGALASDGAARRAVGRAGVWSPWCLWPWCLVGPRLLLR